MRRGHIFKNIFCKFNQQFGGVMKKLLFILLLGLMFISCNDSVSSDSASSDISSTTYNMISSHNYDDSECTENEHDVTETYLNMFRGILQITLNDDGTGIGTTGGENGESFSIVWESTDSTIAEEYRLEGFWAEAGSYLYFDLSETTMAIRHSTTVCTISIFEAE